MFISKIRHCFIGLDGFVFLKRVSYITSLCAIAFRKSFNAKTYLYSNSRWGSQDKLRLKHFKRIGKQEIIGELQLTLPLECEIVLLKCLSLNYIYYKKVKNITR